MSYQSLNIANAFLSKARAEGEEMRIMKLIKLTYLAHGWHLAITDEPLLDEAVEAWRYGPVIPSIYHEFKYFGNESICVELCAYDLNEFTDQLIDKVWDVYKKYSGIQLSNLTHQPDTPWSKTWDDDAPKMGQDIDDDLIKSHFKGLAAGEQRSKG